MCCAQVVSGRQLPKPGGAEKGEIIDPYVMVSVYGVPADCKKAKSTKVIQDNGFNPIWNETSTFQVLLYPVYPTAAVFIYLSLLITY